MSNLLSMRVLFVWLSALLVATSALASERSQPFEPLDRLLAAPNEVRLASGAPGPQYWQQRVDYEIDVELDDRNQRIYGSGKITYQNNSPHTLTHLWFQLDQNRLRPDSLDWRSRNSPVDASKDELHYDALNRVLLRENLNAGFDITRVTNGLGVQLKHRIVDTVMRVDLPAPLAAGEKVEVQIDWAYNVVDASSVGARAGYEKLESGNYIYEIAQWYPRAAAYTDYLGWQNKPFLGTAEFTLEFGDYLVRIKAPADHVVASTGELQNPREVLSAPQRRRFERASRSEKPVKVITAEEAQGNARSRAQDTKTWVFQAHSVRDFAFASSREFMWDAAGVQVGGQWVTAMSYYPPSARALWEKYSTAAVAHTLKVYSRYAFDYPYPVAISVNGPVGGMEYPMITFNKPRPYPDGTYWGKPARKVDDSWSHSKYGLISVIIHEIGHNFYPMVVNSDERRWTWMDEGMNTFVQYLAEVEWEENYPSPRGPADSLREYMQDPDSVPIMSTGDTILQRGNNAYAKPATALNVLREVVLGRELFDEALRAYSERWKFKRPTPTDLFRTFEDIAGIDLDWFWRGWFYTTDYVDVELVGLRKLRVDSRNPDLEAAWDKKRDEERGDSLSQARNANISKLVDEDPNLADFYNKHGEYGVLEADRQDYRDMLGDLDDERRQLLAQSGTYFYELEMVNHGDLVTPVPLTLYHTDGSQTQLHLPAEIWRYDDQHATRLLVAKVPIRAVEFDAMRGTSDVNPRNNRFPQEVEEDRIRLNASEDPDNPLRRSKNP